MFSRKKYCHETIRLIKEKAEKRLLLELYKKKDFTFDFYVKEDMQVYDFLCELTSHHPEYWQIIRHVLQYSPSVTVTYSDRYLNTPLGCILLAQLIKQVGDRFHVDINSVAINISRSGFHPNSNNPASTRIFSNYPQRDCFLKACMDLLVNAKYTEKERNIPHQRTLSVSNAKCTVEIVFDGGISYGWRLARTEECLTLEEMKGIVSENFTCINQLSRSFDRKGVYYVVRVLYKY